MSGDLDPLEDEQSFLGILRASFHPSNNAFDLYLIFVYFRNTHSPHSGLCKGEGYGI